MHARGRGNERVDRGHGPRLLLTPLGGGDGKGDREDPVLGASFDLAEPAFQSRSLPVISRPRILAMLCSIPPSVSTETWSRPGGVTAIQPATAAEGLGLRVSDSRLVSSRYVTRAPRGR